MSTLLILFCLLLLIVMNLCFIVMCLDFLVWVIDLLLTSFLMNLFGVDLKNYLLKCLWIFFDFRMMDFLLVIDYLVMNFCLCFLNLGTVFHRLVLYLYLLIFVIYWAWHWVWKYSIFVYYFQELFSFPQLCHFSFGCDEVGHWRIDRWFYGFCRLDLHEVWKCILSSLSYRLLSSVPRIFYLLSVLYCLELYFSCFILGSIFYSGSFHTFSCCFLSPLSSC